MINTYNSYTLPPLPPPPLPPRPGSRPPSRNTPLLWMLASLLVLNMLASLAGFCYLLYRNIQVETKLQDKYLDDLVLLRRLQECDDSSLSGDQLVDCNTLVDKYRSVIQKVSQVEGKVFKQLGHGPFEGSPAVAHMQPKPLPDQPDNVLSWWSEHSLLKNVIYMSASHTLKITADGNYYIYSQVTFSRGHPTIPLAQGLMLRTSRGKTRNEKRLLKAFCGMKDIGAVCTSFQAGVFKLKKGDELYVNVTDIKLLNFEVDATTFGLFML